jgi:hypothetical protein
MVSGNAGIVPDSTAEAEGVWMSIASKSSAHIRQAHCQIFHDDPDRSYTVPMFTDSQAGLIIMSKNRDSTRTRHVDRRFMLTRSLVERGLIKLIHISGDLYMLADIGTKNLPSSTSDPKVLIICGDPTATIPVAPTSKLEAEESKRSDGI